MCRCRIAWCADLSRLDAQFCFECDICPVLEAELRQLLAEAKQPSKRKVKRGARSSQPWRLYPTAASYVAHTVARRGEVLARIETRQACGADRAN